MVSSARGAIPASTAPVQPRRDAPVMDSRARGRARCLGILWSIGLGGVAAGLGGVNTALATPAVPASQDGLTLTLLTTHPQWGRPLRLRLTAPGKLPGQRLADINLDAWRQNFALLGTQSGLDRDGHPQRLITLSARRSGNVTLPALHLGAWRTAPRSLAIARPLLGTHPVTLKIHLPQGVLWQGQQALITVRVDSPIRYARLDTPAPNTDRVRLLTLPATRRYRANGSQLATGWALFPENIDSAAWRSVGASEDTRTTTVSLPPVRYLVDGVPRFTFYLPRLRLRVRPLPEYVPPGTPVGRLVIDTRARPHGLVREGRLYFWRLRLQGIGIPGAQLPALDTHLSGGPAIVVLNSTRVARRRLTDKGLSSEVDYTVSFKTRRVGWLQLPRPTLRYFDPLDGHLKTLTATSIDVVSLNLFGFMALILAGVGGLGWATRRGAQALRRRHRARHARRLALRSVVNSHDAGMLRHALDQLARAEGWPGNLSLAQWWHYWSTRYAPATGLAQTLQRLSRACYGAHCATRHPDSQLIDLKWHLQFYLRAPRRNRPEPRRPRHRLAHWLARRAGFRRLPGPPAD